MPQELLEAAAEPKKPKGRRFYGVAVAEVVNNIDSTGLGRVKVRLPWLPSFEPWARVAVPMAGSSRGTWLIPQVGDEVVVAFNHGDVREPFVVGSLWNSTDRPPALRPDAPVTKRIIRTTAGHEIEFDDLLQTITITSSTQQKITVDPASITLATTGETAKVALDVAGNVTIQAALSIELKATRITLQGSTIDIKSAAATTINGGAACNIEGRLVKIN